MGIGSARGEGRSVQAAEKAINSPLLEASMEGAHGVLLSIAGGSDLGLFEINEAASLVQESAHPDANIIFGTVIDDSLGDEVRITVIAAGFDSGMPSYKKLDPKKLDTRPVATRTVASGQAGRVSQPSLVAPSGPRTAGALARPAAATPSASNWQPATAGWKPSRAVPVTDDFDDDDEVDVPPFMKR
jgi:cell division protein FtsZ